MTGRHAGHDFSADLPDGRVVIAEQTGFHLFVPRRVSLVPRPHERHLPADILPQELLGLEKVVLVVLFDDADARRFGQRSKVHGRRIHRGRDVHEMQIRRPACDLQIANVSNERDVRVVDGDGQLRLVIERRRCRGILRPGRRGSRRRRGARVDGRYGGDG